MDTRRVDDYLKRLKRRERYLESCSEDQTSHYARAELIALRWIIRYAEDTLLEAAEHQTKWFNEQGDKNGETN